MIGQRDPAGIEHLQKEIPYQAVRFINFVEQENALPVLGMDSSQASRFRVPVPLAHRVIGTERDEPFPISAIEIDRRHEPSAKRLFTMSDHGIELRELPQLIRLEEGFDHRGLSLADDSRLSMIR